MNLGRIFANAVARRLAVVLVALMLSALGVGAARAQGCTDWNAGASSCGSQGQAFVRIADYSSFCRATAPMWPVGSSAGSVVHVAGSRRYTRPIKCASASNPNSWGQFDADTYYPEGKLCSLSTGSTANTLNAKSGSTQCVLGCEYVHFRNGDGTSSTRPIGTTCTTSDYPNQCLTGYFWNQYLSVCEPLEPECDAGQTLNSRGECGPEKCPAGMTLLADNTCGPEKDECPAGNVKAPSGACLPGDGQCAVGEARRPNGTCGKDSDGDGQADEDDDDPDNDPEKESASGGDSCDQPPSCSGSAIACMQVKIQWRIDCNTRKAANISGGACNAIPVCTGKSCDAMEYAQLLQQWKTSCALEKLGTGGGAPGSGEDEAMKLVDGSGVLGNDGLTGADGTEVKEGEIEFDGSGFGWGGSCPSLPNVSVMGQTIQFDTSVFCDWMRLGGVFVMIMAHLAGLAIVMRAA